MIYTIKQKPDKFLENIYDQAMKDFNEFFGIKWVKNLPKLVIIDERKTIDSLLNKKTQDWQVGWAQKGNIILLLNRKHYDTQSMHTYSDEEYTGLVRHEICHCFYSVLSPNTNNPRWLDEGVCIYLSGQLKLEKYSPYKNKKFKSFLRYYSKGGKGIYRESGFVVEILINEFGKNKLLELIKSSANINSNKDFKNQFCDIYNFKLNYNNFNKFLEKVSSNS